MPARPSGLMRFVSPRTHARGLPPACPRPARPGADATALALTVSSSIPASRSSSCFPGAGASSTQFRRSARREPPIRRGCGGLRPLLPFQEDRTRTVDTPTGAGERRVTRPARAEAEPAVLELLRRHGGRLMSVATRYSSTREDAEDAYQRAVEILLRRAPSTDTADLLPWMKTVVKHEAFAVGRQRARHGTPSEADQIEPLAGVTASPAELVERRDRLRLGAEALRRLKPQEVRALLLRAEGLSYREICAATGWAYTNL